MIVTKIICIGLIILNGRLKIIQIGEWLQDTSRPLVETTTFRLTVTSKSDSQ